MSDAPAETPAAKPRRVFTPRSMAPKMTADQSRRQGLVSREAWQALQERDAVMAFLNTHRDELGGRPLDLAVASDEGLQRVRTALLTTAQNHNIQTKEEQA